MTMPSELPSTASGGSWLYGAVSLVPFLLREWTNSSAGLVRGHFHTEMNKILFVSTLMLSCLHFSLSDTRTARKQHSLTQSGQIWAFEMGSVCHDVIGRPVYAHRFSIDQTACLNGELASSFFFFF